MRTSLLVVALATLLSASAVVATEVAAAPFEQREASPVAARDAVPTPFELERRQNGAGLGGGAGGGGDDLTSATGLQTISGYTPPQSTEIPSPVVSSGRILATNQIPGFNTSQSSGAEGFGMAAAGGHAVAALGGLAAGAAYLLF
ncbi:hypothetical protein BDZ90DRAFT_228055 [Jaminaea rosea]|uniref:Uncharacterized protein n=1 Tax=Jaminaea rosea TaxID=1569628 RepID=A0A316ULG0_9BASI|nr:hypothetical protein BDZ90DRAFT_228055 [Jaminaea rosea]PWN26079.1 hypothetical protein BDZ90DRAFT_228055 [Jaminaea rosea]